MSFLLPASLSKQIPCFHHPTADHVTVFCREWGNCFSLLYRVWVIKKKNIMENCLYSLIVSKPLEPDMFGSFLSISAKYLNTMPCVALILTRILDRSWHKQSTILRLSLALHRRVSLSLSHGTNKRRAGKLVLLLGKYRSKRIFCRLTLKHGNVLVKKWRLERLLWGQNEPVSWVTEV